MFFRDAHSNTSNTLNLNVCKCLVEVCIYFVETDLTSRELRMIHNFLTGTSPTAIYNHYNVPIGQGDKLQLIFKYLQEKGPWSNLNHERVSIFLKALKSRTVLSILEYNKQSMLDLYLKSSFIKDHIISRIRQYVPNLNYDDAKDVMLRVYPDIERTLKGTQMNHNFSDSGEYNPFFAYITHGLNEFVLVSLSSKIFHEANIRGFVQSTGDDSVSLQNLVEYELNVFEDLPDFKELCINIFKSSESIFHYKHKNLFPTTFYDLYSRMKFMYLRERAQLLKSTAESLGVSINAVDINIAGHPDNRDYEREIFSARELILKELDTYRHLITPERFNELFERLKIINDPLPDKGNKKMFKANKEWEGFCTLIKGYNSAQVFRSYLERSGINFVTLPSNIFIDASLIRRFDNIIDYIKYNNYDYKSSRRISEQEVLDLPTNEELYTSLVRSNGYLEEIATFKLSSITSLINLKTQVDIPDLVNLNFFHANLLEYKSLADRLLTVSQTMYRILEMYTRISGNVICKFNTEKQNSLEFWTTIQFRNPNNVTIKDLFLIISSKMQENSETAEKNGKLLGNMLATIYDEKVLALKADFRSKNDIEYFLDTFRLTVIAWTLYYTLENILKTLSVDRVSKNKNKVNFLKYISSYKELVNIMISMNDLSADFDSLVDVPVLMDLLKWSNTAYAAKSKTCRVSSLKKLLTQFAPILEHVHSVYSNVISEMNAEYKVTTSGFFNNLEGVYGDLIRNAAYDIMRLQENDSMKKKRKDYKTNKLGFLVDSTGNLLHKYKGKSDIILYHERGYVVFLYTSSKSYRTNVYDEVTM